MSNTWLSNEDYDFVFNLVPRLCVDLIIRKEGGIILSFRDIEPNKDFWHMPGGMVYKNESIENAAKRIAKKESGLDLSIMKLIGFIEFPHEMQAGKDRHTVSIVLEVKAIGGEAKTDFQSKKINVFTDLPNNMHPVQENFL